MRVRVVRQHHRGDVVLDELEGTARGNVVRVN